ncbi:MAG: AAA family ATPase, partial [Deltaproteobacteria bacterium]|nr:AAA family ATPase [Deltaproteobacteria bacterium]
MLFETRNVHVFYALSDATLEDGIYQQSLSQASGAGSELKLMQRGRFERLCSGCPYFSRSLRHRVPGGASYDVLQIIIQLRIGLQSGAERLGLYEVLYSEPGGSTESSVSDLCTPRIRAIFDRRYEKASYVYVKDVPALVVSVKAPVGSAVQESSFTGVFYFLPPVPEIGKAHHLEVVLPGVYVDDEELDGLIGRTKTGDYVLQHPDFQGDLSQSGLGFLSKGSNSQAESVIKIYNISKRKTELSDVASGEAQFDLITLSKRAFIDAIPDIVKLPLFLDAKAQIDRHCQGKNIKFLVLKFRDPNFLAFVRDWVNVTLFESALFQGRVLDVSLSDATLHNLFYRIDTLEEAGPIALLFSERVSDFFRLSNGRGTGFMAEYERRRGGIKPLHVVILADEKTYQNLSSQADAVFKESAAEVVEIELKPEDIFQIARYEWKRWEELRSVEYIEADLRKALDKVAELDEKMQPFERTMRFVEFVKDSVVESQDVVIRLTYQDLENLAYRFCGRQNFAALSREFLITLRDLEKRISESVYGHEEDIKILAQQVRRYYASEAVRAGLREFILIVGDPGNGKTFTAEKLSRVLGFAPFVIKLKELSLVQITDELKRYYHQFYRKGVPLILDELNKSSHQCVFTILHTLLEKGYFEEYGASAGRGADSVYGYVGPKRYDIRGALVIATANFTASETTSEYTREKLMSDIISSWGGDDRGQNIRAILDRVPTLLHFRPLGSHQISQIARQAYEVVQQTYINNGDLNIFGLSFFEDYEKVYGNLAGSGRRMEDAITDKIDTPIAERRIEDRIADADIQKGIYMLSLQYDGSIKVISSISDRAFFE